MKFLKDLQIRKSIASEPMHLESAIDYAMIRSSLVPSEKYDEQLRFLLLRVKEDFTSRKDLWSKDYHTARLQQPDKDLIYQAYMMLIDAHTASIESKIALKTGAWVEAEAKNEARPSDLYLFWLKVSSLYLNISSIKQYLVWKK